MAVLSAFALWPLAALEAAHHSLVRLHTVLTKEPS